MSLNPILCWMQEKTLPEQMIHNAWIKKGYAWFTNGEEMEDQNWTVQIGVVKFFYHDLIQMSIQMSSRMKFNE